MLITNDTKVKKSGSHNSVAQYGVFFSRMRSGIGRNIQFCCERYGMRISDLLHMPHKRKFSVKVEDDVERRAGMIKELVMVRDGSEFVW